MDKKYLTRKRHDMKKSLYEIGDAILGVAVLLFTVVVFNFVFWLVTNGGFLIGFTVGLFAGDVLLAAIGGYMIHVSKDRKIEGDESEI